MTRLRRSMLELFVLALLVVSSAISLGQLNASAGRVDTKPAEAIP